LCTKTINMKKLNLYAEADVLDQDPNLGLDLVRSFHEQFAQNQNHHQNLFLQVLALLISVLIGFGYIYIKVGIKAEDVTINSDTLAFFLVLSMVLLSLSIALILNMSLGYRRDQMVACVIRIKAGVMKLNKDDEETFFPSKFNPLKNKTYFEWLPEFHKIFFISLILIKAILITSSFFKMKPLNEIAIACLCIAVLSIIVDWFLGYIYRNKWLEYVTNPPCVLKE